jgi:hypothetical protein
MYPTLPSTKYCTVFKKINYLTLASICINHIAYVYYITLGSYVERDDVEEWPHPRDSR